MNHEISNHRWTGEFFFIDKNIDPNSIKKDFFFLIATGSHDRGHKKLNKFFVACMVYCRIGVYMCQLKKKKIG